MLDIITPEHKETAGKIKEIMAIYRENEDLINIGAYVKGRSKKIDHAIACIDRINDFLKQDIHELADASEAISMLPLLIADQSGDMKDGNEAV